MEQAKFEELYKCYSDNIEKYNGWIREKTGNLARIVNGQKAYNEFLAILEICYKKNMCKGKERYYVASKMQEWQYRQYDKKQYDIYAEEITTYSYETIYDAILSGSREQMIRMAKYLGSFEKEEKEECNPANTLLGYSLKYVVLDDADNAMKYINQLEESKSKRGMKQFAEGHACALRGLILRDEAEFNQGLTFMLKHHVARMKRNGRRLEQYFAYDSVALAILAKQRDMNITVEHELLPQEYIEESNIDYSAIEIVV